MLQRPGAYKVVLYAGAAPHHPADESDFLRRVQGWFGDLSQSAEHSAAGMDGREPRVGGAPRAGLARAVGSCMRGRFVHARTRRGVSQDRYSGEHSTVRRMAVLRRWRGCETPLTAPATRVTFAGDDAERA